MSISALVRTPTDRIITSIELTKLRYIFLLLTFCMMTLSARELSWTWWPLAYSDIVQGNDTIHYSLGVNAIASSGRYAPYQLQTNQCGDIAAAPFSGNIMFGILKTNTSDRRWYDWDFALTLTGRAQSHVTGMIEAANRPWEVYTNLCYAHVRLLFFDCTVGVKPWEHIIGDPMLTSGNMLLSNNARPLPRISVGIEHYTPIPGLFGYAEIRGGLTHAFMIDNVYVTRGFIHYKYAGVRLGGKLPVNFRYEIHQVAQWGGYSPVYGDLGNDLHAFMNAFLARAGGSMVNDQLNAQGNHIGHQLMQLDVKGDRWMVSAYWQNILEDNFALLGLGNNLADGVWGISATQTRWPFIEGLTYEYINTTDQSGALHDRDGLGYAGNDQYFRNYIYQNGWNAYYRTMGTPLITSPIYNTNGTIYTLNSRVQAHHLGVRGDIYGFRYRVLATYAKNYGNDNRSTALLNTNTALLVEVNKHVPQAWGLDFGLKLATDIGNQFGNSFGAMITIKKTGLLYAK